MLDSLQDLVYIIGYLRDEDDIRAAADACVQRQPARVSAHELDKENAAMGACGGVDIVNDIRRNVNGALKAKGRVGAVNVVIYRFRQGHNIHARVHQKLCAFLRAVAAHYHKAVEIEPVVGVLHGRNEAVALLVDDVLSRDIALAGGTEDGAALREDAGEILRLHVHVVAVDEAAVAVVHSEYLKVFYFIIQGLAYAPHCGVQSLAVSAGGDERHTCHLFHFVYLTFLYANIVLHLPKKSIVKLTKTYFTLLALRYTNLYIHPNCCCRSRIL